jgi:hypothetical protein
LVRVEGDTDDLGTVHQGVEHLAGATKAVAEPARAAPATSKAWAAISRTSPTATTSRSAAIR